MYKATSTRKVQRTEKEIERDLAIVERELESERKLLEASQSELNRIYETSGPTPWTKDLQSKVDEHVKNVARLEGQEESLRAEIPPRPLPQPESVRGSGSLKGRLTSSQNAQAQPGPPPSQSSPIKKSNNVTPKKTPVTSSQYAVVMWGYDARQSDEISLKSNDKVLVLQLYGYKPEDTEWYLVKNTSNGTSGYYPTCYLQLVNELGQLKPPVLFKASVLFDYNSMNEDELDLRIGDVTDVINQDDPGWWTGEIDGKLGLFPANFVQKINSSNSDSKSKNKTLPFVAVSLYGYHGNSADELSFSKGEKLKIIGQEMNGWYKGFLVKAPNKIGLIPGNYIDKQMLEPPIKGNQNTDFKAEFWKNLEKEGRFPIAGAAGTLVGGPPGSEEEPLLEKPKKNEKKGGCCIIV